MNIYILYKSAYPSDDHTNLGVYQLKLYRNQHIFECIGECRSLNVEKIGGLKGVEFCQFDHTKIKKVDEKNNKYVKVD